MRYEDLRVDTLDVMRRLYSDLGVSVEEGELEDAVKRRSWENVPEKEKGEGRFYRKGSPGSWRDDLTPKQARTVERLTSPLLDRFYPGWREDGS